MHIAAANGNLKKRRSSLTNDPRRLPGVDMRTDRGRRFRDIVEALVVEFGPGVDNARLRELGALKFNLEQTQALALAGDPRAREDVVRIANLIRRQEKELRIRKAAMAPPMTPLRQRLAARAASRASDAAKHVSPVSEAFPPDGEGFESRGP